MTRERRHAFTDSSQLVMFLLLSARSISSLCSPLDAFSGCPWPHGARIFDDCIPAPQTFDVCLCVCQVMDEQELNRRAVVQARKDKVDRLAAKAGREALQVRRSGAY